MGVIALSRFVPRFAPLAGPAVELSLGARIHYGRCVLRRQCRSDATPADSFPVGVQMSGIFRIPEVGSSPVLPTWLGVGTRGEIHL
jgi:hypothetical protein